MCYCSRSKCGRSCLLYGTSGILRMGVGTDRTTQLDRREDGSTTEAPPFYNFHPLSSSFSSTLSPLISPTLKFWPASSSPISINKKSKTKKSKTKTIMTKMELRKREKPTVTLLKHREALISRVTKRQRHDTHTPMTAAPLQSKNARADEGDVEEDDASESESDIDPDYEECSAAGAAAVRGGRRPRTTSGSPPKRKRVRLRDRDRASRTDKLTFLQTAAKNKIPVRSGKWNDAEEKYLRKLVYLFSAGLLEESDGRLSMRSWLSQMLSCCPMRISKKQTHGEQFKGKSKYIRNRIRVAHMSQREWNEHWYEVGLLRATFLHSWAKDEYTRWSSDNRTEGFDLWYTNIVEKLPTPVLATNPRIIQPTASIPMLPWNSLRYDFEMVATKKRSSKSVKIKVATVVETAAPVESAMVTEAVAPVESATVVESVDEDESPVAAETSVEKVFNSKKSNKTKKFKKSNKQSRADSVTPSLPPIFSDSTLPTDISCLSSPSDAPVDLTCRKSCCSMSDADMALLANEELSESIPSFDLELAVDGSTLDNEWELCDPTTPVKHGGLAVSNDVSSTSIVLDFGPPSLWNADAITKDTSSPSTCAWVDDLLGDDILLAFDPALHTPVDLLADMPTEEWFQHLSSTLHL